MKEEELQRIGKRKGIEVQTEDKMKALSAVILCGGKSSRMGEDKAGLGFEGGTFLTHILGGLLELDEVLISVGASGLSAKASQALERLEASGLIELEKQSMERSAPYPGQAAGMPQPKKVQFVQDVFADCGPMAGLHAALSHCSAEILFAVSCDMPYASAETARQLLAYMTAETDAVVPRGGDGRVHPLCALYRKSCAAAFYGELCRGNYRMREPLRRLRVCYVPLEAVPKLSKWVLNVNTREAYQELLYAENIK